MDVVAPHDQQKIVYQLYLKVTVLQHKPVGVHVCVPVASTVHQTYMTSGGYQLLGTGPAFNLLSEMSLQAPGAAGQHESPSWQIQATWESPQVLQ
jgi:hypothetical protein